VSQTFITTSDFHAGGYGNIDARKQWNIKSYLFVGLGTSEEVRQTLNVSKGLCQVTCNAANHRRQLHLCRTKLHLPTWTTHITAQHNCTLLTCIQSTATTHKLTEFKKAERNWKVLTSGWRMTTYVHYGFIPCSYLASTVTLKSDTSDAKIRNTLTIHPFIHHIFNEKLTKCNSIQYEGKISIK